MNLSSIPVFLAPLFAGILGWMLSRRKSQAETRKLEAEAASLELKTFGEAVNVWKGLAKDLTIEVIELKKQVTALLHENKKCQSEMSQLRTENKKLREEMQQLEATIKQHNLNS